MKTDKTYITPEPITIPANKLSSCLEDMIYKARYSHQHYLITKQDKPAVMMLGIDDYEDMLDMIDTMAEQLDPKFQEDLRKSHEEYQQGEVGTEDDIDRILKAKIKYAESKV